LRALTQDRQISRKQVLFKTDFFQARPGNLGGRFIPGALMRPYTTIRVGGPAIGVYYPKDTQDLKRFILLCAKKRISVLPIGGGSNIIITAKGLNNIFLKLSAPYFTGIRLQGDDINCGAGVTVNSLINFAEKHYLSGIEFLAGIPATVGGAVFQNAGIHSRDVSCILKGIECLDLDGKISCLNRGDIDFGYRNSGLQDIVILSARFRCRKAGKRLIRDNIKRHLERRLLTQDYTAPSAGCVFKNPDNTDMGAGEMIDRCNLKGKRIGDAQVSARHANFILNKGHASPEDIVRLILFVKKRVRSVYGVNLETEIRII
jgi:UDP-N-acetylmuramate dehydrogenase